MDVVGFVKENIVIIVCASAVSLCLFVRKVDGFVALLQKAVGTVLQQLCSLVIEAICLVFKIANALEIYVVLLIDVLTGKASSAGKLSSLAIGVLSLASFYTTYSGMKYLVEEEALAFLITLGIQAILFCTSLRINEFLELDQAKNGNVVWNRLILAALMTCVGGCVAAYLVKVVSMSHSVRRILYHVLYIVVIVAIVMSVVTLILKLIKTGTRNSNVSVFLFAIYFAVLSVSSFFHIMRLYLLCTLKISEI